MNFKIINESYEIISGRFGKILKLTDSSINEKTKYVAKIQKKGDISDLELKALKKIRNNGCIDNLLCLLHNFKYNDNFDISVTGYIDGIPIDDFAENLEYDDLLYIVYQCINTLDYLHNKLNIIHGDINPKNIMINPDNNVVTFIDFGMSCTDEKICKIMGGNIDYISPKLREKKIISFDDYKFEDIFSLGMVLDDFLKANDYLDLSELSELVNLMTNKDKRISLQKLKDDDIFEDVRQNYKFTKSSEIQLSREDIENLENVIRRYIDQNPLEFEFKQTGGSYRTRLVLPRTLSLKYLSFLNSNVGKFLLEKAIGETDPQNLRRSYIIYARDSNNERRTAFHLLVIYLDNIHENTNPNLIKKLKELSIDDFKQIYFEPKLRQLTTFRSRNRMVVSSTLPSIEETATETETTETDTETEIETETDTTPTTTTTPTVVPASTSVSALPTLPTLRQFNLFQRSAEADFEEDIPESNFTKSYAVTKDDIKDTFISKDEYDNSCSNSLSESEMTDDRKWMSQNCQSCYDIVSLENYSEDSVSSGDLMSIKIYNPQNRRFGKGLCTLRSDVKEALRSDLNAPKFFNIFSIYRQKNMNVRPDANGLNTVPTSKLVVKLNLSTPLYVTVTSVVKLLKSKDKVLYAMPMYNNTRRRVGDIYGYKLAVIPGQMIYKLFTREEIEEGQRNKRQWLVDNTDFALELKVTYHIEELLNKSYSDSDFKKEIVGNIIRYLMSLSP